MSKNNCRMWVLVMHKNLNVCVCACVRACHCSHGNRKKQRAPTLENLATVFEQLDTKTCKHTNTHTHSEMSFSMLPDQVTI